MAHIVKALSNEEYRGVDAYSKSDLDWFALSPALLEWNRKAPSDGSEAVDRGTDLHCALLEPERFAMDYIKAPGYDLKTAAGRANMEAFREASAHNGRKILTADDYNLITAMRGSVMAHPTARAYLQEPGISEPSIFWELDGIKLKCRPDRMPQTENFGHVLVDVKKIDDIKNIQRAVREHRYHVQDAFYSDAYEQLTGHRPRFIFIFVGERRSIGRHPVRVLELNLEWKDAGREAYRTDLERVKEVQDFGFGMDVEVLPMQRKF